jgi:hypothetical protein
MTILGRGCPLTGVRITAVERRCPCDEFLCRYAVTVAV